MDSMPNDVKRHGRALSNTTFALYDMKNAISEVMLPLILIHFLILILDSKDHGPVVQS